MKSMVSLRLCIRRVFAPTKHGLSESVEEPVDTCDYSYVTQVLDKHIKEMNDDHESMTRIWIGKARLHQRLGLPIGRTRTLTKACGMIGLKHKSNPFAGMQPVGQVSNGRTSASTFVGKVFTASRPKGETISIAAPISTWKDDPGEVPNYMGYTSISRNTLGINTRQLQVWPYFGEDIDDDGSIQARFDVVVEDRPRKVLISQQARTFGPYFLAFLKDIGVSIKTVLTYLLEASDGPDGVATTLRRIARTRNLPSADLWVRTVLSSKDKFCEDDYSHESERWVSVLSSLPEADDEAIWKAAIACHAFWTTTTFSPWQIARLYAKFPSSNLIEGLGGVEPCRSYANIACRICQLHDCPHHGTMHERPEGKSSDDDDIDSVDALDIDYPPKVNFKKRSTVILTADGEIATNDEVPPSKKPAPKKPLNWWMNEANSVTWDHSQRGPFFPCYHPGTSCTDAKCSCFKAKICCEKTCGCVADCGRRFRGCTCTTGKRQKVCAQDESCECYRMNRECDPDLCLSCQADTAFAPEYKHREDDSDDGVDATDSDDPDTVALNACRNISLQRSIPKRTLLGRSLVHGFGLYAGEPIAKDEFIGEYQGEIITKDETERRGAIYDFQKLSYLFELNKDQMIDSQRMGNKIRFINHAVQEPKGKNANLKANSKTNWRNVYAKIMLCNTAHRIGMYASRDIEIGEELFFDYGKEYHEKLYTGAAEPIKRKVATKKLHTSRKTYAPRPSPAEEGVRTPTMDVEDPYNADINDDSDEEDRPIKRVRATRQPAGKLPQLKKVPLGVARKTEDRSRHRKNNALLARSQRLIQRDSASSTAARPPKAAVKSARQGASKTIQPIREPEVPGNDQDDDEDVNMFPRRSGRDRKQSRRLRGED